MICGFRRDEHGSRYGIFLSAANTFPQNPKRNDLTICTLMTIPERKAFKLSVFITASDHQVRKISDRQDPPCLSRSGQESRDDPVSKGRIEMVEAPGTILLFSGRIK